MNKSLLSTIPDSYCKAGPEGTGGTQALISRKRRTIKTPGLIHSQS
nr:MAG TPA_asm: hypothetical protein [Caudoviricetes sp.]